MNVMWTNTAFAMYMGQYDAVATAEFEPARRREVLLGVLADGQCPEPAGERGPERGPVRPGDLRPERAHRRTAPRPRLTPTHPSNR